MSTCASNSALTSSGASAEGCSARAVSGTKTGESSCGTLPGGSGGVLGGVVEGVGMVADSGSVVVDGDTEDVGDTVVGLSVVEGTTVVSGGKVDETVSTVGCVSGGGGGMVMGTVEEEVEVEDVELVCSTVLVVVDSSVDVVVGTEDEPTH